MLALGLTIASNTLAQNPLVKEQQVDTFERTISVHPKGTSSSFILLNAPSPNVIIAGEEMKATLVVDVSTNVLYKYDEHGSATAAYLVATGKKSTPTSTGVRVVKNIETYPYRTASKNTKRYKNPIDYGPKALILEIVDPKTGKQTPTGEFIHGNNNPASLGKYASKGCIRMDNEVIKEIASFVKKGDIILITAGERDNASDNEWFM